MNYADNDYKFVAVVNRKIALPRLLNALGHICVGLTSLALGDDIGAMRFLTYKDGSDTEHPAISHWPFIVLEAKNGNQIRTLREVARTNGILYNDFVDTMLGHSAEHQLQQTASAQETDLDYFAIVLFGSSQQLQPLTKKFSLWSKCLPLEGE